MSKRLLALTVLFALAAVGCSSSGATPNTNPTGQTSAATTTPTLATLPAETPPPTVSLTSKDLVAAFASAGLDAGEPTPMTVKDFGLAPKRTDDATHFLVPSVCPDCGGRAFVFTNLDDLRATKAYYDDLGKSSAAFFSWAFANEARLALVQINGDMSKAQATKYKEVIDGLN